MAKRSKRTGQPVAPERPASSTHPSVRRGPVVQPAPFQWWQVAALLALPALVYVVYAPSLDGPFVFDDPNSVTQSELIRRLTPLIRFVNLSTRPLTDYSYAVNYAIGEYSPRPYHATNILLHAINVLLLYFLVWQTLGVPALAARYGAARTWIALVAAAGFAAHPLATETVAYVSSRSEALVATFFLVSLLLYVLATTARVRAVRQAALVLLPLSAAGGLGSKELAVAIPPTLLLYDWCFLAGGRLSAIGRRWRPLALSVLPLVAGGMFLLYRAYSSPTGLGEYGASAGLRFDRFSRGDYLMTQFGVIVHYLRLVVAPFGLSFDYDWKLAHSFWSLSVILPLLGLTALVGAAVCYVRTQPILSFAILWMFLVLAPTSSIVPIADVAVERRMYLPLAGLVFLGATAAWNLSGWLQRGQTPWRAVVTYAALVAVPLVAFSQLTYARATLWGDALALHEDGVRKEPGNPRIRLNLGVTYLNSGTLDQAEIHLKEAKRLYDAGESIHAFRRIGAFIHYNLGAVLFLRRHYDEAVPQLKRALELGGEYLALRPMAYFLLARIAVEQGDYSLAIPRYEEAIKHNGNITGWYVDLALAQVNNGQPDEARNTLRRALHRNGPNEQASRLLKQINAGQGPGKAP
jgi:Tfp pilus assembly protein PilF